MYARTWHGVVPIAYKEGFEKYEYETGVKIYKKSSIEARLFL